MDCIIDVHVKIVQIKDACISMLIEKKETALKMQTQFSSLCIEIAIIFITQIIMMSLALQL